MEGIMKKKLTNILLLAAFLCPTLALAADVDGNKVKEVMEYYHNGKTIVLVESVFCSEIAKEGDMKNECATPVDPKSIVKGSKTYVWMNFFVPGDDVDKANVLVQYKHKGRAIDSSEISMSQSIRYRTWRRLATQKEGDWQISIEQENENGYVNLGTLDYTVVDSVEPAADPTQAAQ